MFQNLNFPFRFSHLQALFHQEHNLSLQMVNLQQHLTILLESMAFHLLLPPSWAHYFLQRAQLARKFDP